MNAIGVLKESLGLSQMTTQMLLDGLSDDDLFVRPAPGANHIAWQLGHLISAERMFMEMVRPNSMPPLPAGFDANYTKETANSDDRSKFMTKAKYLELYGAMRAGTHQALATVTEAELDTPTPESMQAYCKNWGAMINLLAAHELMHIGQVSVVRRLKGLPHAF